MTTEDRFINLEHSVERHESAVTEDAKALAEIKKQLKQIDSNMALTTEALECVSVYAAKSGMHDPKYLNAYRRCQEILSELKRR